MLDSGIFASTADRLHQVLCAMRGHESYLFFEEDRLYLRCAACGHESPGWAIGKSAARADVKPARRPLVRLPAFGTRRAV